MSAYEQQRLENIARNNDVLESLGLLTKDPAIKPSAEKKPPSKRKHEAAEPIWPSEPSRRSERVRLQPARYAGGLSDKYFSSEAIEDDDDDDDGSRRKKQRPQRNVKPVITYESESAEYYQRPARPKKESGPSQIFPCATPPDMPQQFTHPTLLPGCKPIGQAGTSRSSSAKCPLCSAVVLMRAPIVRDGNRIILLNKHWPCGPNVRLL